MEIQKYHLRTDRHRWVGARDACASKNTNTNTKCANQTGGAVMRPWWLGKTCPIELIKKWGDKMDHSNRATKRSRWIDTNKGTSWIIYQTGTSWMGLQKRDQLNQVTERDMCYCWGQFPPTCWMWAMLCIHFITLHFLPTCISPNSFHFSFFLDFLFPYCMHQTHLQPILCVLRSALDRLLWMHRGWLILKWAEMFQQPPHLRIMMLVMTEKALSCSYIFLYISLDIFLCIINFYIILYQKNLISGKVRIFGKFRLFGEILDF